MHADKEARGVAGKSPSVMLSEAKHLNFPRTSEILRLAQNDTRVSGHTSSASFLVSR